MSVSGIVPHTSQTPQLSFLPSGADLISFYFRFIFASSAHTLLMPRQVTCPLDFLRLLTQQRRRQRSNTSNKSGLSATNVLILKAVPATILGLGALIATIVFGVRHWNR
jgi:hypothetical protein